MGIGIEVVGKQSLADWLIRSPSDKTFSAMEGWFKGSQNARLSKTWRGESPEGHPALFLLLYPVAEPVMVSFLGRGRYRFEAKTSTLGPVYHFKICELLKEAGSFLGLRWITPGEDTFESNLEPPRQRVYDAMNDYLSSLAEQVLPLLHEGVSEIQLGMPAGEIFLTEALINTPAGPRDHEWLVRAAKNAPACSDVFPLWSDAPGMAELGLAKALMWVSVRWQKPWRADQMETLVATAELLERAYDLDPTLKYPWREWRELLTLLQPDWNSSRYDEVDKKAALVPEDAPLIGYRRYDVKRNLSDGWSICVPGSFDEEYENGTVYLADLNRSVRITGMDISKNGKAVAPEAILQSAAFGSQENRVSFRSDRVMGVGSFTTDDDGDEIFFCGVAAPGHMKMCTMSYSTPSTPDLKDWSLEVWRSIDKAPADN